MDMYAPETQNPTLEEQSPCVLHETTLKDIQTLETIKRVCGLKVASVEFEVRSMLHVPLINRFTLVER